MTKVPLKKALWIIVLSTFLISGSASVGLIYFNYVKSKRMQDASYNILALVQTCSEKEPLKTVYLAELMHLSHDRVCNLYAFNTRKALDDLLKSPLIRQAEVKTIPPGTVWVNYTSRIPVAYLTDYSNTALDREGVPIPFKPFFTPKNIPEITLGLDFEQKPIETLWGKPLDAKNLKIAFDIYDYVVKHFSGEQIVLKRIDVSRAYASSYGQRQLIVIFDDLRGYSSEEKSNLVPHTHLLRLSAENYRQELLNYRTLRQKATMHEQLTNLFRGDLSQGNLSSEPLIIDLRASRLAFIKK